MATSTTNQDQRKHAMEALERRFAVARAELLQQQQKDKKRSNEEDERELRAVTSSIASSEHPINTPVAPSLNTPSKKDAEANDPAYAELSEIVHESLLTTNAKFSSRRVGIAEKVLHELLQNGDSSQKYIQGSKSMKIDNWIQLESYVPKRSITAAAQLRALRNHSKRSKSHMSMKKHKKCGSLHLPKGLRKFDIFKPMHEIWKDYMSKLLKNIGKNQLAQSLLSADLHGALILVAECKDTAFTGVSGIMIRETAETFGIITQDDKFRVVPKKISVFIFQVDCWKITLHGDKLISRDLGL